MTAQGFIPWLWAAWVASWWIAALVRNRTVARPTEGAVAYRLLPALGAILIFALRFPGELPDWLTWQPSSAFGWTLVGISGLGFAFTWWARIHLGRLWSSGVTRKEHHRVVDTGPYRLVRHPIYTGISLAAFATGVLEGTPIAVLGAAILTYACYSKARIEERFLSKELGPAYSEYSERTPMLVPFAPRGVD